MDFFKKITFPTEPAEQVQHMKLFITTNIDLCFYL